jgi:formylmethanofuran dehydrogenase subunit B
MTASPPATDSTHRAVATITTARRTLVTGLVAADAAVAVAAFNLAEAAGAAVDPGSPETARVSGPMLARIGGVTAAPEELRDRADLVLLWFCNPERAAAGFIERFVAPSLDGQPRLTIAVGPALPHPLEPHHRHLGIATDAAVDLARLVEALIRGVETDDAACSSATLAAARELATAIAAARTVAIVTDWSADHVGLAAWSTTSLVRVMAHEKPAFEVPLGDRDDDAIAACNWRYGAAGAIERADRRGGRFLPAEADAVRLIDHREVDCVMVVGEATAEVAAAIDRAAGAVSVIRLAADASSLESLAAHVAAVGATA